MADRVLIPKQHYIGFSLRDDSGLPLGFMVPEGSDKAAQKRKQTVDNWSKGWSYNNSPRIAPKVIDNAPMTGFRLTNSIRTTNYGGWDKFRIEDPRGFELEITSGNLVQLISVGMVDRGEILDPCVWARHGGNNVLLSVNTQEYKEAVRSTELSTKRAGSRNVRVGNKVALQNGDCGIYLGLMHALTCAYAYQPGSNHIGLSAKRKHWYKFEDYGRTGRTAITTSSSPIAEILDTNVSIDDDKDAEIWANEQIRNDKYEFDVIVLFKDLADYKLTPREVSEEEFANDTYSEKFRFAAWKNDQLLFTRYLHSNKWPAKNNPHDWHVLDETALGLNELRAETYVKPNARTWHQTYEQTVERTVNCVPDKMGVIDVTVTTKLNNQITHHI